MVNGHQPAWFVPFNACVLMSIGISGVAALQAYAHVIACKHLGAGSFMELIYLCPDHIVYSFSA